MRKIPTALVRDPDDRAHVLPEITPDCEWVFAGEGVPTRKWDGTCVKFDGERWWARREVKPSKTAPAGFVLEDYDEVTGKSQGWEPMEASPFVKPWREAVAALEPIIAATYELCGPKVNGNPEGLAAHVLIPHGSVRLPDDPGPRGVFEIMTSTSRLPFEGVVWWHPDGRKAKLKVRDIRRQ